MEALYRSIVDGGGIAADVTCHVRYEQGNWYLIWSAWLASGWSGSRIKAKTLTELERSVRHILGEPHDPGDGMSLVEQVAPYVKALQATMEVRDDE